MSSHPFQKLLGASRSLPGSPQRHFSRDGSLPAADTPTPPHSHSPESAPHSPELATPLVKPSISMNTDTHGFTLCGKPDSDMNMCGDDCRSPVMSQRLVPYLDQKVRYVASRGPVVERRVFVRWALQKRVTW